MANWQIGDKIGPVSQLRDPRVLISWGDVVDVHADGLTVQWPGEPNLQRLVFVAHGMKVERRPAHEMENA